MKINGMELPTALEVNLHDSSYKLSPDQTARLKAVLNRIKRPEPEFFDYDYIIDVNELWTSEGVKDFLGHTKLEYTPGTVDPKLTLIIGEADPDSPIALDYRTAKPRVIYFCIIDGASYWLELSPTYEALMNFIDAA